MLVGGGGRVHASAGIVRRWDPGRPQNKRSIYRDVVPKQLRGAILGGVKARPMAISTECLVLIIKTPLSVSNPVALMPSYLQIAMPSRPHPHTHPRRALPRHQITPANGQEHLRLGKATCMGRRGGRLAGRLFLRGVWIEGDREWWVAGLVLGL
jgi:hypothetical protein